MASSCRAADQLRKQQDGWGTSVASMTNHLRVMSPLFGWKVVTLDSLKSCLGTASQCCHALVGFAVARTQGFTSF